MVSITPQGPARSLQPSHHLENAMSNRPTINVIVMHGEHLIDAGLATSLSRHADIDVLLPCLAGLHESDLPAWIADQAADVLVTDYRLGLLLADAWRGTQAPARRVWPRTVIVTHRATQADVRAAMHRGVAGYIAAASTAAEVIDAVRTVHLGMRHVSEPLARMLLEDLLGDPLTPRETEVLGLAAQGCATKAIAARLRVEPSTVASHMKSVMDKLNAGNRTEAVVIANQRGLVVLDGAGMGAHPVVTPLHRRDAAMHSRRPPMRSNELRALAA